MYINLNFELAKMSTTSDLRCIVGIYGTNYGDLSRSPKNFHLQGGGFSNVHSYEVNIYCPSLVIVYLCVLNLTHNYQKNECSHTHKKYILLYIVLP